jgi:uncharacterized iron-regulated protein
MVRAITCFLIIALGLNEIQAQSKPAYCLFNGKGKKVSYGKMLKKLGQCQAVFFGELHDNPVAHWLELELTKDLYRDHALVLGAEMFETDNQEALDAYLMGKLSSAGLDSSARLWKNYKTDYAPLVEFAKAQQISFAATNVPRRYASLVAKGSFEALDTLSADQKKWLAPLPIAYDPDLPGYHNMLEMMKSHGGGVNLPKAQALKDATMAWSISKYYKEGAISLHFNGSYHSENGEGIIWYLNKFKPGLKVGTVAVVTQAQVKKLEMEHRNKAQFLIVVDEDMTSTY